MRTEWAIARSIAMGVATDRGELFLDAFNDSHAGDVSRFIVARLLRKRFPTLDAAERELLILELLTP